MRLRHIPEAAEKVRASELVFDDKQALAIKGKWQEKFVAEQPLHLEIGMGRGRFIMASALAQPELNFLGLEIREEMIMQALDLLSEVPANIRYLWLNAGLLKEIFAPGEVERIYLNFPDPWPKNRHAQRRLTAEYYLDQFREVLDDAGTLRFKTDNRDLFDWSCRSFSNNGWELVERSFDLPLENTGVVTEYENRYRRNGQPIFFSEWRK